MNAADNGTDAFHGERERLYTEIAALRKQRNGLMSELAACRREVAKLRSQLEGGDA